MIGRRIPDRTDDTLEGIQPGDYWKGLDGIFECAVPNPKIPAGANPDHVILPVTARLGKHSVAEHEDGTITVSPSILIWSNWGPTGAYHEWWHGFLERGIWRVC